MFCYCLPYSTTRFCFGDVVLGKSSNAINHLMIASLAQAVYQRIVISAGWQKIRHFIGKRKKGTKASLLPPSSPTVFTTAHHITHSSHKNTQHKCQHHITVHYQFFGMLSLRWWQIQRSKNIEFNYRIFSNTRE